MNLTKITTKITTKIKICNMNKLYLNYIVAELIASTHSCAVFSVDELGIVKLNVLESTITLNVFGLTYYIQMIIIIN